MTYTKRTSWLNPDLCFGAFPPLALGTGLDARRLWSFYSQWQDRCAVFHAVGVPDIDNMLSAAREGILHFCTPAPDRRDGEDRNYAVACREWKVPGITGGGVLLPYSAKWVPDFPAGVALGTMLVQGAGGTIAANTYGSEATGAQWQRYHDVNGDPLTIEPNAGGWRHSAIALENIVPATLVVSPVPSPPPLTPEQEQAIVGAFGVGRVIRGHDATSHGSLGTLARLIGVEGVNDESLEPLTRRMLVSWAHPIGAWVDDFVAGVVLVDEPVLRSLPRDLRGDVGGTIDAEPVLVVTADEGIEINIYSASDPATVWSYTVPAGGITEQMLTPADGGGPLPSILADGPDSIIVQAVAPSRFYELLLHSLQIFEGPAW